MQTENGLKIKRINHLNWCLEKLKFCEAKVPEEDIEYLYQYIFDTILAMESREASVANQLFLERLRKEEIAILLRSCNIELTV